MSDEKNFCGYCGSYCGACAIQIAYKKGIEYQTKLASSLTAQLKRKVEKTDIQCSGCRDAATDKHSWSYKCKIRACALDKNVESCVYCNLFPCDKVAGIADLSGDTTLKQLQELKEHGFEKWMKVVSERWKCSDCNGSIELFTKKCGTCNSNRSKDIEKSFENGYAEDAK